MHDQLLVIVGILFLLVLFSFLFSRTLKDQSDSHPVLGKIKEDLTFVHPQARDIWLVEGPSSYTEDKRLVHLCLKNKQGEYYSYNTLIFVALHELAHVLSSDIGHGEQWRLIFRQLLNRAEQLGLYDSRIPLEKNYCGIVIEQ